MRLERGRREAGFISQVICAALIKVTADDLAVGHTVSH